MSKPKNAVMIVIDCLGSDSLLGKNRTSVTPRVDRLRERGVSFPNAISAATYTSASIPSLLSGLYPSAHGLRSPALGHKFPAQSTYLPRLLQAKGYDTAAFVSGPLGRELGLERGFNRFEHRQADEVVFGPWGRTFLNGVPSGLREPWFLFLHLWELHTPRYVSPDYDSREYGWTAYDRALSSVDPFLGGLLEKIDPERTVVVLTSDHGERVPRACTACLKSIAQWLYGLMPLRLKAIMARVIRSRSVQTRIQRSGMEPHGFHVYDVLARVPLVIADSDRMNTGGIAEAQVCTIDIVPTMLDLLDIDLPDGCECQGRSLVRMVSGESADAPPAVIEAHKEWPWSAEPLIGVRTDAWKFIFAPGHAEVPCELYDLGSDPEERNNVVDGFPLVAKNLQRQALEIMERGRGLHQQGEQLSPTEKASVEKRLRELGYL